MNLTNSHTAPIACLCHTSKLFQIQTVLNKCASWSFPPALCSPLFFHLCSTETQARPLQGWKLAVYSSSQFPIPWQVFSMTELYVLHSTPLNIYFWLTVKIFALTAQIQNIQQFFNPFGINSFKIILAEEADYKKWARPLVNLASLYFYYCIQLYRCGRRPSVLGKWGPRRETALHSKHPRDPHTTAALQHKGLSSTIPPHHTTYRYSAGQLKTTPSASFTLLLAPCSWSGSALSEG